VESTTLFPVAGLCTPGAVIIPLYMLIDLFEHTGLFLSKIMVTFLTPVKAITDTDAVGRHNHHIDIKAKI